ncbi:hypothetical protein C8F04DRAFT_1275934 [Mycena alexandri]|uniref:Uncharacterized protein n=1 Tax=Mycena alexandri TaxID=1745969 RepID=A0AAD6S1V6_9AGAR|nr:hypothetical protein C8F04DRAFT_1275934 [Mycena alexandri]
MIILPFGPVPDQPSVESTTAPKRKAATEVTINTAESFLRMGLEIQQQQRLLKYRYRVHPDPEPHLYVRLHNARVAIEEHLVEFRHLQQFYMPQLESLLPWDVRRIFYDYHEGENVALFLPSELLDRQQRNNSCVPGLAELEAGLRDIEVQDAQYQIDLLTIKVSASAHILKKTVADLKSRDKHQSYLNKARDRRALWRSKQKYAEEAAEILRS